jgi:dTDP-4-dehydrorhamnose 3,5-epimerase
VNELRIFESRLKGLWVVDLVINADSRGSFREAFQAVKLEALGVPHLGPAQWNISENFRRGIIRGIHAEPWDKYIHCIAGKVFAAIVDLRPRSPTFSQHETFELDQSKALFVSQGLGNAYQTLEDNTTYGYLVNAHWVPGIKYPAVHYADPDLNIQWPLQPGSDDVSEKDLKNPRLREVFPSKF